MAAPPLAAVLDALEVHYGPPPVPVVTDPWELVLFENVVYLADDERRQRAFDLLRARIGTSPAALLASEVSELREVTGMGVRAASQARKLHEAARTALTHFDGDLSTLASMPLEEARRALRRFPAIGEPGADRILLQAGLHVVPALESNGLRALVRLGLVSEAAGYAVTHARAVEVIGDALPSDRAQLLRAFGLLRTHGRGLCRRSSPACVECPLMNHCAYARRTA